MNCARTFALVCCYSLAACFVDHGRPDKADDVGEAGSTATDSTATTHDGESGTDDATSETSDDEGVPETCGSGTLEPGEQCDDGNADNYDGCAETCTYLYLGSGSDGPMTVAAIRTTDTVRTPLASSAEAGTDLIQVADDTGFEIGDEVLIIQMLGEGAGTWQATTLTNVLPDTNSLALAPVLTSSFTTVDGAAAQVIRIPHYTDVVVPDRAVLTVSTWDGSTGGVMAFRALGTVSVEVGGSITVAGVGFVGGDGGLGGSAGAGQMPGGGGPGISFILPDPNCGGGCGPGIPASEGGMGTLNPPPGGEASAGLLAACCQGAPGGQGGGSGEPGSDGSPGSVASDPGGGAGGGQGGSNSTSSLDGLLLGGGGGGGHGGLGGRGAGGGGGGGGARTTCSDGASGDFGQPGDDGGQGGEGASGGRGGGIALIFVDELVVLGELSASGRQGSEGQMGAIGGTGGAGGLGGTHCGLRIGGEGGNGTGGGGGDGGDGGGGGAGGSLLIGANELSLGNGLVVALGGESGLGGGVGAGGQGGSSLEQMVVDVGPQGPAGNGGSLGSPGGDGAIFVRCPDGCDVSTDPPAIVVPLPD